MLRTDCITHMYIQEFSKYLQVSLARKTNGIRTEKLKALFNRDLMRKNPAGTVILATTFRPTSSRGSLSFLMVLGLLLSSQILAPDW